MLNITRKVGEKIIIGEDVVLEVMEVSGSSVRLGIRAPRSVPVYREEIWDSVPPRTPPPPRRPPPSFPNRRSRLDRGQRVVHPSVRSHSGRGRVDKHRQRTTTGWTSRPAVQ